MAGRKIRDAEDARACLAAAAASGLSRIAWARSQQIDGRSLNAWGLNLTRRGQRGRQGQRQVQLVELVAGPPTAERASYVIRRGELSVEVDEQFDSATLRRLLDVIAQC